MCFCASFCVEEDKKERFFEAYATKGSEEYERRTHEYERSAHKANV